MTNPRIVNIIAMCVGAAIYYVGYWMGSNRRY